VIPVDLFGRVAPVGELAAWAEARGMFVIEDAAQAIGARDAEGRPAGSRGLAGAFSFFPSKNLGAFGDGGLVTTQSEALASRLRELRNHGRGSDGLHRVVGTNSRLDALQAAVLRVKLRHLESWTKQRLENADFYDRRFAEAGMRPAGQGSGDAPLRTPPPVPAPAVHVYNQYVVRVRADLRDPLRQHLAERGVETRIYYERGLHREPCFAELATPPLPASEAACRETLALPIHPELSPADREHVAESVIGFLNP
jgi:dTDP-4-amino-4,6-dideoxygalactose transaminase